MTRQLIRPQFMLATASLAQAHIVFATPNAGEKPDGSESAGISHLVFGEARDGNYLLEQGPDAARSVAQR